MTGSRRRLVAALVLAAALAATSAEAHAPRQCIPAYQKAGKANALVVSKGAQVQETSLDGLDASRSAGLRRMIREYHVLADQVGQLLGAQTAFFEAMTVALECTANTSR